MPAKTRTVEEYLARVSDTQRAALEKLRRQIKAAAPAAGECVTTPYQATAWPATAGLVRRG